MILVAVDKVGTKFPGGNILMLRNDGYIDLCGSVISHIGLETDDKGRVLISE